MRCVAYPFPDGARKSEDSDYWGECVPFDSIDELQKVQLLATQCIDEVGLQSSDGSVSVDAKSFIGMYALDFTQPIWVCCDDPSFHKKIRNIGENIE